MATEQVQQWVADVQYVNKHLVSNLRLFVRPFAILMPVPKAPHNGGRQITHGADLLLEIGELLESHETVYADTAEMRQATNTGR